MATKNFPVFSDPTYRIEAELGSGGGGVVYRAWHTRLQKHVVIKELKSGSAQDLETQRNEVEALKNVKSAYLPQVFDFLTEDGHVYTVMEFIEGESLDKLLMRGYRFSQPQVVKWYGQLISALEVIHRQNICHRDIKPANIMLTPSGDVCLIDFNAALVSGNDVRLISRSLGYASPEQYEIYERYRYSRGVSPINLGSSSVRVNSYEDTETELIDEDKTALLEDSQQTEWLTEHANLAPTEYLAPPPTAGIDWKRSDVYSLGATMYHLLSGVHPPQRAVEVVPISRVGHFSEGIVYVIEQSMRFYPQERFASAQILGDALRNIHKHDRRWRASQSKKIAAAIILPLIFVLFVAMALWGRSTMAQEKEERYYDALVGIQTKTNPQVSHDLALEIYGNRIDPYRAMAERLWQDGDIDECRAYIEKNLGNIAKFQAVPQAQRSVGDIYFILGNCYYYQPLGSDYYLAKEHFKTAVQYVKDNPAYYRDYAITLARVGEITEAEQVLAKAETLNLETDSLNLSHGEISYAKKDYDTALQYFHRVISSATDDYLRYRAYHTADEICKLQGRPDLSIDLLSKALNRIPLNRVPEMTERLADAYVKNGNYDQAILLFEQLSKENAPRFHILNGLAILLQEAKEYDRAATILNQMSDLFPQDYRVPMRQAFLEADRQSTIPNEFRDYFLTKQYYEHAAERYYEAIRPGEADPEMQQLEDMIDYLRQNKWID